MGSAGLDHQPYVEAFGSNKTILYKAAGYSEPHNHGWSGSPEKKPQSARRGSLEG